jgi:hypothetical protein
VFYHTRHKGAAILCAGFAIDFSAAAASMKPSAVFKPKNRQTL